jgi:hypothetical protein
MPSYGSPGPSQNRTYITIRIHKHNNNIYNDTKYNQKNNEKM